MPILNLQQLAEITGSQLSGDPSIEIDHVDALDTAGPAALSFLTSSKYRTHLEHTRAGVVILKPEDLERCPVPALIHANPNLAYALAATALSASPGPTPGIHPSSVLAEDVHIEDGVCIEPHCVVGAGSRIAAGAWIGPGCVIGAGCSIGAQTRLVANVFVGDGCSLGARCLVQPSAVIGADGFGMADDQGTWVKIPQLGAVRVGDDVEIGACTTIDRGAIQDTVIEDGVKLDNQIQIAHNVRVGKHTAMAAGVGISGSTQVGAHCTVAGQVGMAGHLELSDHTHVLGQSAITRSIREPGVYVSTVPAMPYDQWRKNFARLKQLDDMARRIKALEKALQVAGVSAEQTQDPTK